MPIKRVLLFLRKQFNHHHGGYGLFFSAISRSLISINTCFHRLKILVSACSLLSNTTGSCGWVSAKIRPWSCRHPFFRLPGDIDGACDRLHRFAPRTIAAAVPHFSLWWTAINCHFHRHGATNWRLLPGTPWTGSEFRFTEFTETALSVLTVLVSIFSIGQYCQYLSRAAEIIAHGFPVRRDLPPPYPRYPLREFTPCAPGRSIQ